MPGQYLPDPAPGADAGAACAVARGTLTLPIICCKALSRCVASSAAKVGALATAAGPSEAFAGGAAAEADRGTMTLVARGTLTLPGAEFVEVAAAEAVARGTLPKDVILCTGLCT